jgi:hypothetical protein
MPGFQNDEKMIEQICGFSGQSFLVLGERGNGHFDRLFTELFGGFYRRALMVAASRVRTSLLMIWLIHCREQSGNRLGPEFPAKHKAAGLFDAQAY